ncbi:uncharacterized protein H6S33_007878 [Morchella sextelata]|uniref:uncharacterized protein n=1 Tax=Morchella sextelata TaxID=1174677 RepID=UPI001D049E78|nr:uncharacterized protein H6S33_007878 [Morchella sextelata]KAH0603556.1 hypothetical protein H6S33_007878 [Morchella sextelata]
MAETISLQSMRSTQDLTSRRRPGGHTSSDITLTPPQKQDLDLDGIAAGAQSAGAAPAVLPKSLALKQLVGAAVTLLVLFWANTSWIMGKMYKQADHAHRLHILAIDLDGGPIGSSLLSTTALLSGTHGQPTYVNTPFSSSSASSESYSSIYTRVRTGGPIWGAIIANPSASTNLSAALTSNTTTPYDATTALTIIYNEARFRTVEISLIYSNLLAAAAATAATYQRSHGAATIASLSNASASSIAAALQPVAYTVDNITPFGFSSSVLLNTVMFVFPPLSQFFVVMAANGILAGGAGAYARWSLRSNLLVRAVLGTAYPCLIGLSWAGWVYTWKDGADLGAGQYFLSWLTVWLYASINFWVIDGTCAVLEMRWMPFFVITAIITQVSAVLSPMELASNFYRIEYLLPSHHIWGILMTIFGNGAANELKVNLTVAVLMLPVAASWGLWGNWRRWTKASAAVAAGRA